MRSGRGAVRHDEYGVSRDVIDCDVFSLCQSPYMSTRGERAEFPDVSGSRTSLQEADKLVPNAAWSRASGRAEVRIYKELTSRDWSVTLKVCHYRASTLPPPRRTHCRASGGALLVRMREIPTVQEKLGCRT
jgi:hypothetical protein